MNPKIIARTAAVVVLAGAVLACALEFAQRNRTPAPSTATAHDNMDPLADEPSRCKAIGAEAANDAACKVAWSQNSAPVPCAVGPVPGPFNRVISRDIRYAAGSTKIHRDRLPSTPQSDGSKLGTNPEGR
jgi:conjugative transfer region protein TrbK